LVCEALERSTYFLPFGEEEKVIDFSLFFVFSFFIFFSFIAAAPQREAFSLRGTKTP